MPDDPYDMFGMGMMNVGGNLLGNYMANQFNQSQVLQQENYQTQMSNTAYQRSVRDMEAAGLNPILAVAHPESAPSGAMTQMNAPQLGDAMTAGIQTAKNMQKQDADIDVAVKQGNQLGALTEKTGAETANVLANTARTLQEKNIHIPDELEAALRTALLKTKGGQQSYMTGKQAEMAGAGGSSGLLAQLGIYAGNAGKDVYNWVRDKYKSSGSSPESSGGFDPTGGSINVP